MYNRPKGTKDIIPAEVGKWQYVENVERTILASANFQEIRTPVFEHTELFLRSVGETTDIVNKEMYTFTDKGGRSLTLRPEGTAGIVRAFIENGLDNEALPLKLFMFTSCFRYERPQAGRLREHHQCSIEAFGSASAKMDVEVIASIKRIFDALHFSNYQLNINSIGCKHCRQNYIQALHEYYKDKLPNMCEDCKQRYEKNPLRLLDCKNETCQAYKQQAPKTIDYLCDDCKQHFQELQEYLTLAGVPYVVNPNIVRGLDYYNRTVFEFLAKENGAMGTICGGGRYDGLIESMGGKSIPSVGAGIGFERLLGLLEKENIVLSTNTHVDVYVACMQKEYEKEVMSFVYFLRQQGVRVEYDFMQRSLKAELKYANKIGAKYLIVYGENEATTKNFVVKEMATGKEIQATQEQLIKILK